MRLDRLAPRESEVACSVLARGGASAVEVARDLSDPLSNSAVRSMLRRLQAKGVLTCRKEGRRFIYAPADGAVADREAALRRMSAEHFGGSLLALATAALELARPESMERRPALPRAAPFGTRAATGCPTAEP